MSGFGIDILKLVAVVLLVGMIIGAVVATFPRHTKNKEASELRAEAIRRGFAHYTNDIDGNSTFVWKDVNNKE